MICASVWKGYLPERKWKRSKDISMGWEVKINVINSRIRFGYALNNDSHRVMQSLRIFFWLQNKEKIPAASSRDNTTLRCFDHCRWENSTWKSCNRTNYIVTLLCTASFPDHLAILLLPSPSSQCRPPLINDSHQHERSDIQHCEWGGGGRVGEIRLFSLAT